MKTAKKKKGPKKGATYSNNHPYEFGQILAQIRKKRGLTQTELAEKLNTTKRMVSHWEREVEKPYVDLIQKLAGALDVPEKIFLGGKVKIEDDGKPLPRGLKKRMEVIKDLSPKSQKSLQDYIDTLAKAEKVA